MKLLYYLIFVAVGIVASFDIDIIINTIVNHNDF